MMLNEMKYKMSSIQNENELDELSNVNESDSVSSEQFLSNCVDFF